MADEVVVLVRREGRGDRVDEQAVEVGAGDPLVQRLVEVPERGRAELVVGVDLEVGVGELPVLGQLVLVREVVAVADGEVVAASSG